jgi:oxygen-independent coproporphyrinogen III oxidase
VVLENKPFMNVLAFYLPLILGLRNLFEGPGPPSEFSMVLESPCMYSGDGPPGTTQFLRVGAHMLPGKIIWKPLLQKLVTGQVRRFRLTSREPRWPGCGLGLGLYLHVPFCKKLCPYCPYNRVQYEEDLFAIYERAIKQEIDLYEPRLRGSRFNSLYIGGGTPTVNWPGLLRILTHLRQRLPLECDICIELHPANMDLSCLQALKDFGVNALSIGVETTSDVLLQRIGRNHDGRMAIEGVRRAVDLGFQSINVDLMFALPGQTLEDWATDVKTIVDLGVDQLSTYPLFTFPYSELGQEQRVKNVTRPGHRRIRSMLEFTDAYCEQNGLHRCAVWSWLRPSKPKFSSITRHRYVGFGPSAASMTGGEFYVNTFDVNAYAEALPGRRPVAVSMPVSPRLEMAYWLYWRIYELKLEEDPFQGLFGPVTSLERQFGPLMLPLVASGLMTRTATGYEVTKSGAYWIHRLQNEYSLNYIDRLWGACRKEPWPETVRL